MFGQPCFPRVCQVFLTLGKWELQMLGSKHRGKEICSGWARVQGPHCVLGRCPSSLCFYFGRRTFTSGRYCSEFYLTFRCILLCSECLLKSLRKLRGKSAAIRAVWVRQAASFCQYARATWSHARPSVPPQAAGSELRAVTAGPGSGCRPPAGWVVILGTVSMGSLCL